MSSHTVHDGRFILAYHPLAAIGNDGVADAVRAAERLNDLDKSDGRWAVHVLGPEVDQVDLDYISYKRVIEGLAFADEAYSIWPKVPDGEYWLVPAAAERQQ